MDIQEHELRLVRAEIQVLNRRILTRHNHQTEAHKIKQSDISGHKVVRGFLSSNTTKKG